MFTNIVVVAFLLCLPYTLGRKLEEDLMSFGDFMEFNVGISKACVNANKKENAINAITESFKECIDKVSNSRDLFEGYENICKNRAQYHDCWDKMKVDTLKRCGNGTESKLPAVYPATVKSFCGKDNGASKSAELKKAAAEIGPADENKCPDGTGGRWREKCKTFLDSMNSPDICARHEAIDKCMRLVSCEELKLGKTLREVYTNGKSHLKCTR